MEALVIVGIMMSFATTSRPASGSEHHLSHFFEITGIVKNQPYLAHGIDVVYSTVVTAKIREEILKNSLPEVAYKESYDDYSKAIEQSYGSVAGGCIALQERLGTYKRDRLSVYKERESEIRNILKEMPSESEIENMLALVGLNMKEYFDLYGKKKINNAIKYAKDLKDRYTVLWLAYDMGVADEFYK